MEGMASSEAFLSPHRRLSTSRLGTFFLKGGGHSLWGGSGLLNGVVSATTGVGGISLPAAHASRGDGRGRMEGQGAQSSALIWGETHESRSKTPVLVAFRLQRPSSCGRWAPGSTRKTTEERYISLQ